MTIAAIIAAKGNEVLSIGPDDALAGAVALLSARRIGAMPVVDAAGAVRGVISERDVIRHLADGEDAALRRAVRAVMTAPAVTVAPHDSVIGALSLMTQRRIRHLPVVADGRLAGIVSIGDLVKYRIDQIEADARAMRDYIQQA